MVQILCHHLDRGQADKHRRAGLLEGVAHGEQAPATMMIRTIPPMTDHKTLASLVAFLRAFMIQPFCSVSRVAVLAVMLFYLCLLLREVIALGLRKVFICAR